MCCRFSALNHCPSVEEVVELVRFQQSTSPWSVGTWPPEVTVDKPMTVLSIAHVAAEGILQRWARARIELAAVRGAGSCAPTSDHTMSVTRAGHLPARVTDIV